MSLDDVSSVYLSNEDEEEHIVINDSRTAIVPNSLKIIAVTGDKDIETVTFDCVRYWDGNDLSTFAIYLNYVLPDNTAGTYIPDHVTTSDGEDVFHFDWKIKNNITQKSGEISFAITAIKTKQNESGQTVVDKQWSSIPNGDCSIALGLDISNVPDEEEATDVVAQLSAILEQIHGDVDQWIKTAVVQSTGTSQTKVMSQKAVTDNISQLSEEIANKYIDKLQGIIPQESTPNKIIFDATFPNRYYDENGVLQPLSGATSWWCLPLIPCNPNTIYDAGNCTIRTYKADGTFVRVVNAWVATTFTTSEDEYYFGVCSNVSKDIAYIYKQSENPLKYVKGEKLLSLKQIKGFEEKDEKKYVPIVVDINGNGDYTSLSKAIADGHKNIEVRKGVYDIQSEFKELYGDDFFDNFQTATQPQGLVLNGAVLKCDAGVEIRFEYSGTNERVISVFSTVIMQGNGGEIHGGKIYGKNCRYTIHDDVYNSSQRSKTVIEGCEIVYNGTRCAIGGGFGQSSHIEVLNNVITQYGYDADSLAILYHNSADTTDTGAKSFIIISGNVINGTRGHIRIQSYGQSTSISQALVTNNKCTQIKKATTAGMVDNLMLTEFNNITEKAFEEIEIS